MWPLTLSTRVLDAPCTLYSQIFLPLTDNSTPAAWCAVQAKDSYGTTVKVRNQSFLVSLSHMSQNLSATVLLLPQPGSIHGVTILNAGSGCASGGTLSGAGGDGAGFSASFTVSLGGISSVTVLNGGDGYTSMPTLSIASGGAGCFGFSLAPALTLAGDHYGSFITTVSGAYRVAPVLLSGPGLDASVFNNTDLRGTPMLTRVDPTVSYLWGEGLVAAAGAERVSVRWEGVLKVDEGALSPSAGLPRSIRAVHVLKRGSGCTTTGTLSAQGGGGAGFQVANTIQRARARARTHTHAQSWGVFATECRRPSSRPAQDEERDGVVHQAARAGRCSAGIRRVRTPVCACLGAVLAGSCAWEQCVLPCSLPADPNCVNWLPSSCVGVGTGSRVCEHERVYACTLGSLCVACVKNTSTFRPPSPSLSSSQRGLSRRLATMRASRLKRLCASPARQCASPRGVCASLEEGVPRLEKPCASSGECAHFLKRLFPLPSGCVPSLKRLQPRWRGCGAPLLCAVPLVPTRVHCSV